MNDDEESRFLAACDDCGSVYAVTETADGQILPIGSRTGCPCGGATFTRVAGTNSDESREDD